MRLEKLRSLLQEHNVDAFLVGQPENRLYLSGFTGSAGWLIISRQAAILATDFRYFEQVGRQSPDFDLAKIETKFSELLPGLLMEQGVARLGFECEHMTVDQYRTFEAETGDVEWVPLSGVVEALRVVKEEDEIEALRRSEALTGDAFTHMLEVVRPGMTEIQVAWEIESYMRLQGARRLAFDLIVAAGPNGALPHARPGTYVIQEGDPIVIDIGCKVDGYCSDMTRTICLGEPSEKYLHVWEVVHQAQTEALASIRSGMSGAEADAVARDVIENAGYGAYFGHSLGHGVGLAVHEAPRASRLSKDTLLSGMSLTVEPGIYLPGEFGVRIEDLVIVRDEGTENLTNIPKTPVLKR